MDSLDDRSPSSPRREGPSPVEFPAVADVQAAPEPLTGLLEMGKATGPDSIPNEILPGAGQNFIAVFADLIVRVFREGLARWHDDTSSEAGTETLGSGQRTGGSPQQHAGNASCQAPHERRHGARPIRGVANVAGRLSQQSHWSSPARCLLQAEGDHFCSHLP